MNPMRRNELTAWEIQTRSAAKTDARISADFSFSSRCTKLKMNRNSFCHAAPRSTARPKERPPRPTPPPVRMRHPRPAASGACAVRRGLPRAQRSAGPCCGRRVEPCGERGPGVRYPEPSSGLASPRPRSVPVGS